MLVVARVSTHMLRKINERPHWPMKAKQFARTGIILELSNHPIAWLSLGPSPTKAQRSVTQDTEVSATRKIPVDR